MEEEEEKEEKKKEVEEEEEEGLVMYQTRHIEVGSIKNRHHQRWQVTISICCCQ